MLIIMDKNAVLYMFKNPYTEPHVFMESNGYICVYTLSSRINYNTRCSCYHYDGLWIREKELIHYDGFNIHYFKNYTLVHTLSSSIIIPKYHVLFDDISNRLTRKTNSCHIEHPICLNSAFFLCDNCHITMKKYIWKQLCAWINILSTYDGLIDDTRGYIANIMVALYVRNYNR